MNRGAWVLIAGLLLASTCAHRRTAVSVTPQPADSVTVNIINHGSFSMVIFAQGSGQNYRMGIVDPGTTGQFVLRFGWLWGRSVEFVAGEFSSGHLNLRPGDIVDFEMTTESSRAIVRP